MIRVKLSIVPFQICGVVVITRSAFDREFYRKNLKSQINMQER